MRLLILTQKVDRADGALSFMIGWIRAFAEKCEEVTVIALSVGEYELPKNVRVLSLGKENGVSRLGYVRNLYRYVIRERDRYDRVFVHMNEIYVLLAGPLWRALGKRVSLWYAHGSTSLSLRIATWIADPILTSSPSGFRIATPRLRIVGQGIDTVRFPYRKRVHAQGTPMRLLVVGRLSPSKDISTLLSVIPEIERIVPVTLDIVGGPGTPEQESYLVRMKALARELGIEGKVTFHGAVPHEETVGYFHGADVFVSTATNGSFDKAMGDAMATGLPLVCCNDAMKEVLGDLAPRLMFEKGSPEDLTEKLLPILRASDDERSALGARLREIVEKDHSLPRLIDKILAAIG